ncbi:MAG: hypothetical protein HYY93_10835 [Planctomycetes bacterium]|nr:hypothetical protein [Planctomycetota bacterium]
MKGRARPSDRGRREYQPPVCVTQFLGEEAALACGKLAGINCIRRGGTKGS